MAGKAGDTVTRLAYAVTVSALLSGCASTITETHADGTTYKTRVGWGNRISYTSGVTIDASPSACDALTKIGVHAIDTGGQAFLKDAKDVATSAAAAQ